MSPKKLLLLSCCLPWTIIAWSQRIKKETVQTTTVVSAEELQNMPFRRGVNLFTVQQNFNYSRTKPETGVDKQRNIAVNLDYNRFVADNFAIGLQVQEISVKTEVATSEYSSNQFMAYANIIYGHSFDNFNLYGKISVGVGQSKDVFGSNTSKDDLFGYGAELGAPFHIFNGGGNFITPYFSYTSFQQKSSGTRYTDNRFALGLRFENYSPCDDYLCDCSHGRPFSGNIYDQGRNFFGYSTTGDFGFGTSKYSSNGMDQKNDFSGGALNIEYGHYFIRNLAVGAGINWSGQTDKGSGSKYTSSSFTFTPTVTYNLPFDNCANNFFLQGGYGFGFEKNSSGSNTDKYNLSSYGFNIGFNDFFGKHLAFTPRIGYQWQTSEDTNTNIKNKRSGLQFGFGCTLHY